MTPGAQGQTPSGATPAGGTSKRKSRWDETPSAQVGARGITRGIARGIARGIVRGGVLHVVGYIARGIVRGGVYCTWCGILLWDFTLTPCLKSKEFGLPYFV